MEAMAASALVSSGCPGRAVAADPVATTGNALANVASASSAPNVGEPDVQPERFRPVTQQVAIAEQVEWRELQFSSAQPRLDGDVGPDTRRFA